MPGRAPRIQLKRLGFAKVGPGGGLELIWGWIWKGGERKESSWELRGESFGVRTDLGPSLGGKAWPLSRGTPVMRRRAPDSPAQYLYSCIFRATRLCWKEHPFCLFGLGTDG